jgi:hypothetical protein
MQQVDIDTTPSELSEHDLEQVSAGKEFLRDQARKMNPFDLNNWGTGDPGEPDYHKRNHL